VDGTKSKQKEDADMAEKTLRKNKKRLSNFPKPVVRRKMLYLFLNFIMYTTVCKVIKIVWINKKKKKCNL